MNLIRSASLRAPFPFRALRKVNRRPSPFTTAFLLLLATLAVPLAPAQPAHTGAGAVADRSSSLVKETEKDPVLTAMREELDRSMSRLGESRSEG